MKKNKKRLKTGTVSCILGIVLCACAPQHPTLLCDSIELEYGQDPFKDISLDALIDDYDTLKEQYDFTMHLKSGEHEIKLAEDEVLGTGRYLLQISCSSSLEPLDVQLSIKDTIAPVFEDFKEEIWVDYGYSKELAKLFTATDLADVEIRIDGEIDTNKAGRYQVKVIAEDENGNQTTRDCTIIVKEKSKNEHVASSGNANTKPLSGTLTNNTSNSSSSGAGSSGSFSGNHSNKPVCTIPANQYGNSGMKFNTKEEARAWAEAYIENDDANGEGNIVSYGVIGMSDTCDQIAGYTVQFNIEGEAPDWGQ